MKNTLFTTIFTISTFSLLSGCAHSLPPAHPDAFAEVSAGNARFAHKNFQDLSAGQKPKAIVISCSDSRVPPELVFDQGFGDLFTIRSAGEALSKFDIASAEYAVENLGSKLIIVMGHSSCGAVKAAANTPPGKSTGSKNLDLLVDRIRPQLGHYDKKDAELIQASKNNVDATVADLLARSPLLRKELDQNKIEIKHALYHLKTGQVDFW